MKLISYRCPNCNSFVQLDISKRSFFCTYCGAPLSIDFGNNSFTYIEIDEAKIRKAEAKAKIKLNRMDYELRKIEMQNNKEKEEWQAKLKAFKYYIIFIVIFFILFVWAWNSI